MFEQVKIILIKTTHPGNIGAVARAMKNMGFTELCLVAPKHFPADEALARASGAEDILEKAQVVNTLEEAIADCDFIMGLSARIRKHSWPTLTPRVAAQQWAKEFKSSPSRKAALVFGQEQSGMLNGELALCHRQISIPADPKFASLNVAQAVQLMTYEFRMAILEAAAGFGSPDTNIINDISKEAEIPADQIPANAAALESFYKHLENTLVFIKFLDPKFPGYLMHHLRRLFAKAAPTPTELNILRGMLNAMQKEYSLEND